MARRRESAINTEWAANLAYLIGIIASDGNLSKARSKEGVKKYAALQIGDKNFYDFLLKIGLTERKSKTIGPLQIPDALFADFLRECIDGDGSIQIWKHKESKNIQFKMSLYSASKTFLEWIKCETTLNFQMIGGWIYTYKDEIHTLCYGKGDAFKILKLLYYDGVELYLDRKYQTYLRASGAIGQTR